MKTLTIISMFYLFVAVADWSQPTATLVPQAQPDKGDQCARVCHKGKMTCVLPGSVQGHLAHGDTLLTCGTGTGE